MKIRIPTLIVVAVGMTACSMPEPGSPAWVALQEHQKQQEQKEAVKDSLGDIPDWYAKPPLDEHGLYQGGTSTSSDLQLALDKAVLAAKRSLADRVNGALSSKLKEFLAETGAASQTKVLYDSERVTTNLITEVNLAGYTVQDKKIIPAGSQYRVYVLLQYPLDSANRILMDQIKKDQALETQVQASKAYQELEHDIQDARHAKAE